MRVHRWQSLVSQSLLKEQLSSSSREQSDTVKRSSSSKAGNLAREGEFTSFHCDANNSGATVKYVKNLIGGGRQLVARGWDAA
jgi:hypothetical protein